MLGGILLERGEGHKGAPKIEQRHDLTNDVSLGFKVGVMRQMTRLLGSFKRSPPSAMLSGPVYISAESMNAKDVFVTLIYTKFTSIYHPS